MFNFQINPKLAHWDNEDTYIFVNPNLSKQDQQLIKVNKIPLQLKGMIWVGSSGTTASQSFKLIGLTKKAFLSSAEAVCERLKITDQDIWLSILPRFHVAGLAVEARSYISGCRINALNSVKFEPLKFVELLKQHKVTVTSLVPTQVFELIKHKLSPPKSLRFIYVGGAGLSHDLYEKATSLGWQIVLTYGMTEAASSVATSLLSDIQSLEKPSLYLLDHIKADVSDDNTLVISGDSVSKNQIIFHKNKATEFLNLKDSESLRTEDIVKLSDKKLQFIARKNQQVKISGELVNLNQINDLFENFKLKNNLDATSLVTSGFHPKYGQQVEIHMQTLLNLKKVEGLVSQFNDLLPNYQKIKSIYFKNEIASTALGKLI